MQPVLPLKDVKERFDFAALRFLGADPVRSEHAYLLGPHGVTFKLRLHPEPRDWRKNQVAVEAILETPDIHGVPHIDHMAIAISHRLVFAKIWVNHPHDLPAGIEARTQAVVQKFADAARPSPITTAHGTPDLMFEVFRDFSTISRKDFNIWTATGGHVIEGPSIAIANDRYYPGRKDAVKAPVNIRTLIDLVDYFWPTGSLPDFSSKQLDQRLSMVLGEFLPAEDTGHERLEAASRLAGFLKANFHDIGWSTPMLKARLKALKIA